MRGATLAGRVVDEKGAPVERALVQVGPAAANPLEAFRRRLETRDGARSDVFGSFRVARLRPGDDLRVDVSHDAYESRTISGIEIAAGATRSGLTVVLRRGLAVKGVVKDEEGRPLEGVEVELDRALRVRSGRGGMQLGMFGPGTPARRETGGDGRFEITGLEAGDFTLTAHHPGFARATVDPLRVAEGGSGEPVELVLHPGATISGVVHDHAGRGAAGWLVAARGAGEGGSGFGPAGLRSDTPTGPDGVFLVEGATRGETYELQAMGTPGLGPRVSNVTAPAADVEIMVVGAGQIRGQVLDADSGRPVPDFEVSYQPDARGMRFFFRTGNGRGPYAPQAFHAEDGAFVLDHVPEGRWQVAVRAEGYQGGSAAGVVVEEGGSAEGVDVRLSKGGVVSGRVLEAQTGRPILDATVQAEQPGGGRRGGPPGLMGGGQDLQATTDAEGRFEITGLAPGTWTLTATHPTGARRPPPSSLRTPRLRWTGGRSFGFGLTATTDSGGRFSFEDLEPRSYRASFQKAAYEAETRELEATEDGRDVRVELRRGEGLGLEARDGTFGTPLRGLMVRALDAAGSAVFTGSVPLDSDGRGEVPSLKPGSYELRVASSGYAPVVRPGVLAPSTGLVLALTPGGTLEIHVGPRTLALLQPKARLYGPDGRPYVPSVFATDGEIPLVGTVRRLENVVAGRYRLAVEGGESRDVEVREGGGTVVELP